MCFKSIKVTVQSRRRVTQAVSWREEGGRKPMKWLQTVKIWMVSLLGTSIDSDEEQSVEDYTRSIELNPEDAEAYFKRGLAYANFDGGDDVIAARIQPASAPARRLGRGRRPNTFRWRRDPRGCRRSAGRNSWGLLVGFHPGLTPAGRRVRPLQANLRG
jgi:hypothetical protein